MEKTHWKNLHNYEYLGAYSFVNGITEVVLTIKEVKKQRVTAPGGSSEDCIVAHFEETNVNGIVVKPMVLNKTNCKIISKVYDSEFIEDWIGKKIIVFSTTTKFARDTVACLRVKNEKPVVETYKCKVCGKEITKQTNDASVAKYGVALCSKECLDSYNENKGE